MMGISGNMSAPNSYRQVVNERIAEVILQHETGVFSPYIINSDGLPFILLATSIFSLYYFRGVGVKYFRYVIFSLITANSLWIIKHVRAIALGYGYAIGLTSAIFIFQSVAMLLCNDPSVDFKRLEVRVKKAVDSNRGVSSAKPSGAQVADANGNAKNRKDANGHLNGSITANHNDSTTTTSEYYWQPYPSGFWHRLDWSVDLAMSFRGPGWNWRLRTFEPLGQGSSEFPAPASAETKRNFWIRKVRNFLILYFILDAMKVILMHDPFFVGTASLSSPAPEAYTQFFPILAHSPFLTRFYRLLLSCSAIVIALNYIFLLGPMFFGLILPKILLRPHYTPLTEPFMYPPQQNSFSNVLDHGIGGFWGQWWHQLFRFIASEPSRVLLKKLGWNRRDQKSRILQLFVAFTLTGLLHAPGSYTTYRGGRPLEPFLFFFFQGMGILVQTTICKAVGTSRLPRWLRRTGNLLTVSVFMYYTGPLFADEFAAAGMWNFEPVPISLVRFLGFGFPGEGWWCVHGPILVNWPGLPGDSWWRKGWAVV